MFSVGVVKMQFKIRKHSSTSLRIDFFFSFSAQLQLWTYSQTEQAIDIINLHDLLYN